MADANQSTTNVNPTVTNSGGGGSATDDVTVLANQVPLMDGYRVAQLQLASAAAAAESASLAAEAQRLAAKYGPNSEQAQEAAARLTMSTQEQAALATDLARATVAAPPVSSTAFTVYGRVVDSSGAVVAGAQLNAITPAGASLNKAAASAAGAYVLAVPIKDTKETVTFEVQIAAGGNSTTFPELFIAVPGRLAYRDLTLPSAPGSTAPPTSTTPRPTTTQACPPESEAPRKIMAGSRNPRTSPRTAQKRGADLFNELTTRTLIRDYCWFRIGSARTANVPSAEFAPSVSFRL